MAHRTRWRDLRAGLLVFAAIIALAALVLVYARVGSLHGDTFEFYVATNEARGVIRGSEVWLDGQKVGLVKNVHFGRLGAPDNEQLLLRVEVLESARQGIRADSRAAVRSGGSLIGAPVVYITTGTARGRAIAAADTLRSVGQTDYEGITSDVALASRELPAIISNVKLLTAQIQSTTGTLGALGIDRGGSEMAAVRRRASQIMARVSGPTGNIGRLRAERGGLMTRARAAMAQADTLRALVASERTSLGRFRRDSTLQREIAAVLDELTTVRELAANPKGTIGRLQQDMAIRQSVDSARAQLAALLADVKKHPFRYINF